MVKFINLDDQELKKYDDLYRNQPRHVLETVQKSFQNSIRNKVSGYAEQAQQLLPVVNTILEEMNADRKVFGPNIN